MQCNYLSRFLYDVSEENCDQLNCICNNFRSTLPLDLKFYRLLYFFLDKSKNDVKVSKEKKVLYQKVFINDWLDDSFSKDWLRKHEKNTKEKFIVCQDNYAVFSKGKAKQM